MQLTGREAERGGLVVGGRGVHRGRRQAGGFGAGTGGEEGMESHTAADTASLIAAVLHPPAIDSLPAMAPCPVPLLRASSGSR